MRHWFYTCSQIPTGHLEALRIKGIRPTIKIILYDLDGFVWMCENVKGRLALPGGGIDEDELPVFGLLREVHEEIHAVTLSLSCVWTAPLLHYAQVRTHREGFSHKGVYIVAALCPDLRTLQPKNTDVLRNPQVIHVSQIVQTVHEHSKTPFKLKELYMEGFEQLQYILK